MTAHLPADDTNLDSGDVPFKRLERALISAALLEETAAWCRKSGSLRIPGQYETDILSQFQPN